MLLIFINDLLRRNKKKKNTKKNVSRPFPALPHSVLKQRISLGRINVSCIDQTHERGPLLPSIIKHILSYVCRNQPQKHPPGYAFQNVQLYLMS